MERDFTYPSSDGLTLIHAVEWTPHEAPRAAYLIAHGMQEYIRRYTAFAEFLCGKGFVVCGNDHLGHGESVVSDDRHGYFAKENGNACLIADMHKLRTLMEEKYPGLPVFYMGHSMGSFLVRQYIMMHGSGLAGAVIMGTGSQPAATLSVAKMISRAAGAKNGYDKPSPMLANLSTGSYTKRIENPRTYADWITKDEEIVDRYVNDPWCTFPFTANAYYNMFLGIQYIQKKENEANIPKDLPLLFVAGAEDPVGHYGKDVPVIYERYKMLGIRDISIIIYPDDRHEILNETDKEDVYADIGEWLDAKM